MEVKFHSSIENGSGSVVLAQQDNETRGFMIYGPYPNFGAGTNSGRCATFGRICGKYVASLEDCRITLDEESPPISVF